MYGVSTAERGAAAFEPKKRVSDYGIIMRPESHNTKAHGFIRHMLRGVRKGSV